MRTMFDSVTAANIPYDAQIVAGYIDGRYAWKASDWALFPKSVKVKIAVNASTNDGNVLDVEAGNATPEGAVSWVRMRRISGQTPTVYCNLSTWQSVKDAFAAAGENEPLYWLAYWNENEDLPPGTVAHQYKNTPGFDLSIVADRWDGVDQPDNVLGVTIPNSTLKGKLSDIIKELQSLSDEL